MYQFVSLDPSDQEARDMADLLQAALNAPPSPELADLLAGLPVRYPADTPEFAVWVAVKCAEAGLPDAAAAQLVEETRADKWDTYPQLLTAEMIICPADIPAWRKTHPDRDEDPRMDLATWWATQS